MQCVNKELNAFICAFVFIRTDSRVILSGRSDTTEKRGRIDYARKPNWAALRILEVGSFSMSLHEA